MNNHQPSTVSHQLSTVLYPLSAAAALMLSGCATNPDTGAPTLFGFDVPESAFAAAETAAEEASSSGGLLGIVGVVAGTALSLWRRRREIAVKDAALSVIDGVDEIIAKARAAKESGKSWSPTPEEIVALVKAVQNHAGTRGDVDELRKENA